MASQDCVASSSGAEKEEEEQKTVRTEEEEQKEEQKTVRTAAESSRAKKEEQKKVRAAAAASSRAKKEEQKTVRVAAAATSRAEEEEQKKTVRVTSNDGVEFEMDEAAARGSGLLRHMLNLSVACDRVTLPVVSGKILALAVSYLTVHRDDDDGRHGAYGYGYGYDYGSHNADTTFMDLDRDLVKTLDQATLIDLVAASNYMNIEGLLHLTCQTVADMFKGKTIEEIRQTFCIQNDYLPEEEEEVRREISWALEEI